MRTIVAPTDFSDTSINAVNYAAELASVIGADLSLIYVYTLPLTFSEVPIPPFSIDEQIAAAENHLNVIKERLQEQTKKKIKIRTQISQGEIVSEIDNYCTTLNPYAVVMGVETRGNVERLLLGGKTLTAMRRLHWPLIVVPPEIKFTAIRKIGLACDFRNVMKTVPVNEIKQMVEEFHAELHVLHVSTEIGNSFSYQTVQESGGLHQVIGELKPKYHFINGTDIEENVNEFAKKNDLDLLIVIPKKHNLVNKIFTHSHSKRLVLHTHIPVMAIHE